LRRIRLHEYVVGAFRSLRGDVVLRAAQELDRQAPKPLTGVLVAVKDVIDTIDSPTGYGSLLFSDHQPAADAVVIGALKRAGALIVGKTETSEFGIGQYLRTGNPVDLSRTPGTSSGGSAAAVAAGMVPVALGLQTAGSVIRPASYCGIYGYKPTRGWTSIGGIWPLARSLDTIGLFARSAGDLYLTYQAIRAEAGARRQPGGSGRQERAAAILMGSEWATVGPEVLDALYRAATRLALAGWAAEPMAMPASWRRLPDAHDTIMTSEIARNMRLALGPRVDRVSPDIGVVVDRGVAIHAREREAALLARNLALDSLRPLSERYELIIAPGALSEAPAGRDDVGDPVMCRPWTLLGLPVASVPVGRSRAGLPIGVQVIGTEPDDDIFLSNLISLEPSLVDRA